MSVNCFASFTMTLGQTPCFPHFLRQTLFSMILRQTPCFLCLWHQTLGLGLHHSGFATLTPQLWLHVLHLTVKVQGILVNIKNVLCHCYTKKKTQVAKAHASNKNFFGHVTICFNLSCTSASTFEFSKILCYAWFLQIFPGNYCQILWQISSYNYLNFSYLCQFL